MDAYVKLENVTKIYRMGEIEIHAADGIDFEIMKGEFVVIVGPSGAGKTTVLNVLGGMDTATEGQIWVDGKNVAKYNPKELTAYRRDDIGFVFQFHHLLPEFSALENVMLPALIAGRSKREAEQEAANLLKMMNLSDRTTHKPSALSGGEQQRVAIARAIVNHPALLLADEPSGNLDTKNRDEIHSLFFHLRDTLGQTTVIVTHDEELAQRADRKITMRDGMIL